MYLHQLPYNVILQILWNVSPNKLDFSNLRATCKRLAEITRDKRFDHLVTCGKCPHNDCNIERFSCFSLIQKGEDINLSMLNYIVCCKTININILKFFVDAGADVNWKKGCMMRNAQIFERQEVIDFLISYGAKIYDDIHRRKIYQYSAVRFTEQIGFRSSSCNPQEIGRNY